MAKANEKNAEMREKRADAEVTKKAVKNLQSKVEKTTLGDLGVLADLKKKMDHDVTGAEKAIAPKEEVKPITSKEEVNPVTSKEEVKPATSKEEIKPTAPKDEVNPVASKEEIKPATSKEEVNPVASKEEIKPT